MFVQFKRKKPNGFSPANKGLQNSTLHFVSVTVSVFQLSPVSMPVKRHNKGIQTQSRFTVFTVFFSNRRVRVLLKPQKNICSKSFTTAKYCANSKAFKERVRASHAQRMIKICIRLMKNGAGNSGIEKAAISLLLQSGFVTVTYQGVGRSNLFLVFTISLKFSTML